MIQKYKSPDCHTIFYINYLKSMIIRNKGVNQEVIVVSVKLFLNILYLLLFVLKLINHHQARKNEKNN